MRQRGPARIENRVLPLGENFEPRVEMKLQIMSRRNPEEEEGNLDGDRNGRDRKQWSPEQRGLTSGHIQRLPERMLRRARLSQMFLRSNVPRMQTQNRSPSKHG